MVILKSLLVSIFFFLLILPTIDAADVYVISMVEVDCQGYACDPIVQTFKGLENDSYTTESLREKSRFLALNDTIASFSFDVFELEDGSLSLHYFIEKHPRIKTMNIESNVDIPVSGLGGNIYRTGAYYNPFFRGHFLEEVRRRLSEMGMQDVNIKFDAKRSDGEVDLNIFINIGQVLRVSDIDINTDNEKLLKLYRNRLTQVRKKLWDQISYRVVVDEVLSELVDSGFYDAQVNYTENVNDETGKVSLELNVIFGRRYQLDFRNNYIFSRGELLEQIRTNLANNLGRLEKDFLEGFLVDYYEKNGFYDTNVQVRTVEGTNRDDIDFINFYVRIDEGRKLAINDLSFIGNLSFSDETIEELYYENATVMAKRKYLDQSYINRFSNVLRREYLSRGFVFAEVDSPFVSRFESHVDIEYRMRERQQITISSINFKNVPDEVAKKVREFLLNQEGQPINIIELEQDFRRALDVLHEQGYYFARIKNINDENLLNYDPNYQYVEINLDIELGRKSYFDGALVSGLEKTRERVILREIQMERMETLTPEKVERLRRRLNFLGLFSTVEITPFILNEEGREDHYLVSLLIQVEEKDFGALEIAPGFRTDIGVKISTDVSYNNLWGMNRAVSLRTEVNQRLDFANLDQRRRQEEKRMLEFLFRGNYNEPYLFGTKFQYDLSATYQRRRFFSFDADIRRFSHEVSRSFGENLTLALKYQFETIRQYDATEERDNDSFRIGSVIPSIGLDFRDDPINPKKGAYFGLSWEYASPAFGSLETDELVVNFHKLVSRNQVYIPMGDWTLATSLAMGYERNLSNDIRLDEQGNPVLDDAGNVLRTGFIPSIKVFRLDGIDTVRGYREGEINRLRDGREIGEVPVQDEAYFVNFKLEPRYQLTENFMVGSFFDAGRIFIDEFSPLKLRTSAGLTFKVVTPVGSLDFDYGVKLQRKRDSFIGRESFGRFHLSIGHF